MTTPDLADLPDLSDLPELLGSSPKISSLLERRLEHLINDVFDRVEDVLDTGDAQSVAAIMKMVLPLAIAVKTKTESSGEDMELIRQQALETFAQMGGGLNRGGH